MAMGSCECAISHTFSPKIISPQIHLHARDDREARDVHTVQGERGRGARALRRRGPPAPIPPNCIFVCARTRSPIFSGTWQNIFSHQRTLQTLRAQTLHRTLLTTLALGLRLGPRCCAPSSV